MKLECPQGWNVVKLSDLGEVNRGRSRHRPRHASHLYGGPYPFIQTGDVKASGGRVTAYQQTYSEAGLQQSRLWPADTMCITIAANIAETGVLQFPACFPDSVIGFIADESIADVYFTEYMFRYLKRYIQHASKDSGTVQDNINLGTLDKLLFPVPDLPVQKAISRILCAFDNKIELNCKMNHTLEAMAQAIFKSWFVDFDSVTAKAESRHPYGMNADTAALFPAHFVESGMGPIPEGWNVSKIADLAQYVNGKNFTKNATGSGRMVVRIAELNSGPGASTVYNEVEANEDNTAYPGDLLFSWSGSLDVYRWHQDEALVNQHIFKVIPQGFPQWFVYFQLREAITFFQGIAADKATTMGHIKREHLSQAKLALPTPELITAMDSVVNPLYQRIHQNERESITLADIRDALLPKLLSGEVRVGQAEQLAAEIA